MPILSGQISIPTGVPQSRHRLAVIWPILDELPTSGSPATLLGRDPKADLQPVQHSSLSTAILSTDEVHSRSAHAQSDSVQWNVCFISRKWPWEPCKTLLDTLYDSLLLLKLAHSYRYISLSIHGFNSVGVKLRLTWNLLGRAHGTWSSPRPDASLALHAPSHFLPPPACIHGVKLEIICLNSREICKAKRQKHGHTSRQKVLHLF